MEYRDMHTLSTTKQILGFLESLSVFIEHVYITDVSSIGFKFCVKVPLWYKLIFGWWIKNKINKELKSRLPLSISFDFNLHT